MTQRFDHLKDPRLHSEISVGEATPADHRTIGGCLARAFEDDPVSAYIFPDSGVRASRLHGFYRAVLRLFNHVGVIHTDDQLRGAAAWQPPAPVRGLLATLPAMIQMGMVLRSGVLRLSAINDAVIPFHPSEPHWYLAILGTDPATQGSGVGSALIRPTLERCDRDGILAYLESSKEENILFYERHGFRVAAEINIPKGPKLWGMQREPQPTR